MRHKALLCGTFILVVAFSFMVVGSSSAAEKKLRLGAQPVGSVFNLIGTAVAKVVGDHTSFKILVRAVAGTSAWLPLMDSREVDLGIIAGTELYDACYGVGVFQKMRQGKGFAGVF
jgi:TRAP-type uncharacterized transport system substrate-binding protein